VGGQRAAITPTNRTPRKLWLFLPTSECDRGVDDISSITYARHAHQSNSPVSGCTSDDGCQDGMAQTSRGSLFSAELIKCSSLVERTTTTTTRANCRPSSRRSEMVVHFRQGGSKCSACTGGMRRRKHVPCAPPPLMYCVQQISAEEVLQRRRLILHQHTISLAVYPSPHLRALKTWIHAALITHLTNVLEYRRDSAGQLCDGSTRRGTVIVIITISNEVPTADCPHSRARLAMCCDGSPTRPLMHVLCVRRHLVGLSQHPSRDRAILMSTW
jgi:hypothetical protein